MAKAEKELIGAIRENTNVMRDLQISRGLDPQRRYIFFFIRGVMQGLGVLVAAIVIIPLMIPLVMFFLQQIEWVPIVGNFATKVIRQVEQTEGTSPRTVDQ